MVLRLPLRGQAADPRRDLAVLCPLGQFDGLCRILAIERDQCPADQSVRGKVVITTDGRQINGALRPPQRRLLVSRLLHQPTDILGVPGTEPQQSLTGLGTGMGGQLPERMGLRGERGEQESGTDRLTELPILAASRPPASSATSQRRANSRLGALIPRSTLLSWPLL
nr:hypothetical protein [Streptosporangium roseum]